MSSVQSTLYSPSRLPSQDNAQEQNIINKSSAVYYNLPSSAQVERLVDQLVSSHSRLNKKSIIDLCSRLFETVENLKDKPLPYIAKVKRSAENGLGLSGIISVRDKSIESCDIIINTKLLISMGATRKMELAVTLDGTMLAHQRLNKKKLPKKFDSASSTEYKILSRIMHPNIVSLLLVRDKGENMRPGFYYEYLPEEVTFITPQNNKMDVLAAVRQIKDVAAALKFCHSNKIFHLDIKPDNIRVAADGTAKLIDFGNSVDLNGTDECTIEILTTYPFCSPYYYKAWSENLLKQCGYNLDKYNAKLPPLFSHSDRWSLACTIFIMLNPADNIKNSLLRMPLAIKQYWANVHQETDARILAKKMSQLTFLHPNAPEFLKEIKNFADMYGSLGKWVYKTFTQPPQDAPSLNDLLTAALEYETALLNEAD